MMQDYLDLIAVFCRLGLLAVGGLLPVLPDMQRAAVDVHHWVTASEFTTLFALAQSAPGPNMMVVTLLGAHVAGVGGGIVASVAFVLPPCTMVFFIGRLWQRLRGRPWLAVVQTGLTAVTVGLIAAAGYLLVRSAGDTATALGGIAAATLIFLRTKLHPLWVLGLGAALGAVGLV
jgi:chromate transporter